MPWRDLPEEGEVPLPIDVAHHLVHVLRLRDGDAFVAFDPARGVERDATLAGPLGARLGPGRAGIVAARAVTLVQALAKGDKLDAVVRDATELGASRVVVARAARSVVRLEGARADERRARWARIAEEAARQSGRADAPGIVGPLGWTEALAAAAEPGAIGVCLDPRAEMPALEPIARAAASGAPLALAVGPEGGLTDDELAAARGAGWSLASLGPYVLRTETVAAAALGAALVLTAPSGRTRAS